MPMANLNGLGNFNNVNYMPGMKNLTGPQGLSSLTNALQNKGSSSMDAQNAEVQNTLGITAPSIHYHGIGPLGQIVPKV